MKKAPLSPVLSILFLQDCGKFSKTCCVLYPCLNPPNSGEKNMKYSQKVVDELNDQKVCQLLEGGLLVSNSRSSYYHPFEDWGHVSIFHTIWEAAGLNTSIQNIC